MANELGKPKTVEPPISSEARRRYQHHPAAKQLGITGDNGLDSYYLKQKNKKYGGYGIQSLAEYRSKIVKRSECMNPVQGVLGKRARLKREQTGE